MVTRLQLIKEMLRRRFDPCQMQTWMALRHALAGCESVLDLGCGDASNMRMLHPHHLTGIDGYAPDVEKARARGTHDSVVLGDIRHMDQLFQPGQFDACVGLDVIEHLPKAEGYTLAAQAERVAKKVVVFLTPNGFLPQRHTDRDDLQVHLSGWDPQDFTQMGYHVMGLLGPKRWRGEYHVLQRRPRMFWSLAAFLMQSCWTSARPDQAAALLAVKQRAGPSRAS